jgi:hypothetical protein
LKLLQSASAIGRLFYGPMEKAFIDPTRIHPKVRRDRAHQLGGRRRAAVTAFETLS